MKTVDRSFLAAAAALLLLFTGALAQAEASGGTYLQVAYADWDGFDDGFNVAGSFRFAPIRLFAEYTDTDMEHLRFGAAWGSPLAHNVQVEIGGSRHHFEIGPSDERGFAAHGILRLVVTPGFNLAGRLERVFLDDVDDETIFGFDAHFRATHSVSLFAAYDIYDELDNDLFKVGLRLHL